MMGERDLDHLLVPSATICLQLGLQEVPSGCTESFNFAPQIRLPQ